MTTALLRCNCYRLFVYSNTGHILDKFNERWQAIGVLNRWNAADFVLQGNVVIARKASAAIAVGDTLPADEMKAA